MKPEIRDQRSEVGDQEAALSAFRFPLSALALSLLVLAGLAAVLLTCLRGCEAALNPQPMPAATDLHQVFNYYQNGEAPTERTAAHLANAAGSYRQGDMLGKSRGLLPTRDSGHALREVISVTAFAALSPA
jgi:hypothetical protein